MHLALVPIPPKVLLQLWNQFSWLRVDSLAVEMQRTNLKLNTDWWEKGVGVDTQHKTINITILYEGIFAQPAPIVLPAVVDPRLY